MPIEVAQIRTSERYGFKFAETKGMIHDHASWWTFEDEQSVRDRHWHIKPGDVVLDIGAAFGSYALPALALGGTVIAFNPSDFDSELCALNVAQNPDLAGRFIQVRDGIGAKDGWFDPDHSVFSEWRGVGAQWLRVQSLDSWLAQHDIARVDWIKMDIEGAELDALRGAEQTIRRFKPKILIENHIFHRPTMERDVASFLVGLGIGYVCDGPYPYHAVSHSYFEVK